MKSRLFSIVSPGVVAAGMWLAAGSPAPAAPETGAPAPAFTLQDIHGQPRSLADYKGKYVVLEWTNYGCPFVKKHYESGNMQKLQKAWAAKGVVWLSICSSAPGKQGYLTPDQWPAALEERGAAPAAVLPDPDGKTGRLYGATATPGMFVISPKGILIYSGAIDSIASADKADIARATNYVSAALDAAMAGKPVPVPSTAPYGCSVKYEQ